MIQNKFISGIKTLDENRETYIELLQLKELIFNTSIINLNSEELELLDNIRFKVLENLCLMEMDLREHKGISTVKIMLKLEELYKNNKGEM